ncbi:hypothetical protein F9C11_21695 [Amycolatopsis sp. VS8301801F10]|uniref:hypothetical protein n=1 Tax=Amycolatopsis sp. VS8301801F10 TaxID=2652442 RepID=UPI0038FD0223
MSVYTHCPPWVTIFEDTDSVRSPGWYEGTCWSCQAYTTGSEPVVEDWADDHWACSPTALETLPIRRGTARRLGLRHPSRLPAVPPSSTWPTPSRRTLKTMRDAVNQMHENLALARDIMAPVRPGTTRRLWGR